MWTYFPKKLSQLWTLPADAARSVRRLRDLSDASRNAQFALSCTWNATSLAPDSWQRVWKQQSWIRPLFGQMLEPSMAQHGVDSWISSLRDIRANRTPTQATCWASETHEISGVTYVALSNLLDPQLSFWRTSITTYDLGLEESPKIYERWVSVLTRQSLVRRKLVRPMFEIDSSFSDGGRIWQTPTSRDGRGQPSIRGNTLDWQAEIEWLNHHPVLHPIVGRPSSNPSGRLMRPRLSPIFVNWLMDFPLPLWIFRRNLDSWS